MIFSRDQVRLDDFEVLVGDDERDVVAVRHDVRDERVVDRAAAARRGSRCSMAWAHSARRRAAPSRLQPPCAMSVGVEQRQQRRATTPDDDHHHPVAERERIAVEQVFHDRRSCGIGFIFATVSCSCRMRAYSCPSPSSCDGAYAPRGRSVSVVLDNPLRVAVAQDDVVVDRLDDLALR